MDTCQQVGQLRKFVDRWKTSGETIAFVPTMGNLHHGHLSLVEIALQKASRVVVSIYVNPMQFSPDEDFDSYPRTLDDDLDKLRSMDVDLVFTPDDAMIYPRGKSRTTFIEVPGLSHIIEGEFRPGFFRGVATVVMKLFNMVQPDIAIFGEKDYQQLLVIRQMVADLNLPIEIIGAEIKREADGLAMSSRNNYLDSAERENSRLLSESLQTLRHNIEQGMSVKQAEADCCAALLRHGFIVDYVTTCETGTLKQVSDEQPMANTELIVLAAARLGKTRLIDNLKFNVR